MHPVVSRTAEYVVQNNQQFAPLLLGILATSSNLNSPVQHALLVTACSWLFVLLPVAFRVGISSIHGGPQRRTAWLAGAFLALAQICDRAVCDHEGVWVTKALLPLLVVFLSENDLLAKHIALPTSTVLDDPAAKSNPTSDVHPPTGSYRLLVALTVSASVALAAYTTSPTTTLGLSSVIFSATGLVLFAAAIEGGEDESESNSRGAASGNGTSPRRMSIGAAVGRQQLAILRDVAGIMTLACGVASFIMEPSLAAHSVSWEPVYSSYNQDWTTIHHFRIMRQVVSMVPVQCVVNVLTFVMLSRIGAVFTSLLVLFSYLCAKLIFVPSLSGVWFTIIYGTTAFLFTFGSTSSTSFVDIRSSIRLRRIVFGVTIVSIGFLLFRYALQSRHGQYSPDTSAAFTVVPPPSPFAPIPVDLTKGHPAAQLISAAETDFQTTLSRQSKSLSDAVREYRRRNGVAPPPHFDKWYEFATRNKVVMIDEFDNVNHMLLPFWALNPATIRSRVSNALGHEDSAMIAVAIRNGAIANIEHGEEWQQQATTGMMKQFIQHLPDMDLGFNMHDEPRVVVPTVILSSMIAMAQNEVLPRAAKHQTPRNAFSKRPQDMNDGKRFTETFTTRFNRFAHQQTWTHSRLSCPPDSQAQTFEDYAPDNLTAYAASPLNYVYNTTAFSDICNAPSLSSTFGFFERPNAFNIIHELTPVFSPSKISSFQDLLYPSPWYWVGKVGYDDSHDTTWENKTNSIYWRGSTTGGFSRNGGWRRQHRQHIVQRLNALDKAQILTPVSDSTSTTSSTFSVTEIDRRSLKHLVNVKFSHVGQCDPGDCDAQTEFFHVTERADGQDAWYHKHLLDMDGNAFSGRFYSFLKSRSLTYKMAMFREWHSEWLRPWVHYIPLSLKGDEHLDLVKWFAGDTTSAEAGGGKAGVEKKPDKSGNGDKVGEKKAREIAERSTEWHDKVLRNVDFEVWFFRLLLEYARVIDDNREEIGYPGP